MTSYARRLRNEQREIIPSERNAFARLIGLRLKQTREALELEQKDMGAALGITQSAYSKLESGNTEITVWQLAILAEKLKSPLLGLIPPR